MKRNHGPPVEGTASFHTTRLIVMRAAQSQARGGESALAELCQLYAYPLSIFARRRGYSPEDAQDLTQGVFLHAEDRAFRGRRPAQLQIPIHLARFPAAACSCLG